MLWRLQNKADERVARAPKMARAFHCCPNFFYFFSPTSASEDYVYIYTYLAM